jgi:hypothetical protein
MDCQIYSETACLKFWPARHPKWRKPTAMMKRWSFLPFDKSNGVALFSDSGHLLNGSDHLVKMTFANSYLS